MSETPPPGRPAIAIGWPRILRILAVACLIVALICAAVPTSVFGAHWTIWVTAGLIAWCVEPLIAL